MKIIFDSEEQKKNFLKVLGDAMNKCPSYCGFMELSSNDCTPATKDNCSKCWEQCGIEMEVKSCEIQNQCQVACGIGITNEDVQLMSKEEWMNKRLDDIRKAIEIKTRMLQIVPIAWHYEYNELVAKLKVEDEDE